MSPKHQYTLVISLGVALALAALTLHGVGGTTGAVAVQPDAAAPADPRPNIVFITTDDMRIDDLAAMPTVQRLLADQGTTFVHSRAPFPLCCPARAAWMTGQYNHNNGVMGNGGPRSPLGGYPALDSSSTIATWLSDGGYQTAFIGKYLSNYGSVRPKHVPAGWLEWHTSVAGGDYMRTKLRETDGQSPLEETVYDGVYQVDLYDRLATDVIARRVPRDAPLFLWVSDFAPHGGRPAEPDDPAISNPAVPERYRDLYAGVPLATGPAFNEEDVSDKPEYVRDRRRLSERMQAMLTESNQQRLESLQAVDDSVGHIVSTLAESGELDNTVIAFSSDNGYMFGEHRIHAGKTVPYEASVRVPLIIRGPGFAAGVKRRPWVANIDVAPTFADLADVTPGLDVDGRSLLPLVAEPRSWANRKMVLEAGPKTVDGEDWYHGVLAGRYKYIEYNTGEVELYDLRSDPHELVSLAEDPAYKRVRTRLAMRLRQMEDCAGQTCR